MTGKEQAQGIIIPPMNPTLKELSRRLRMPYNRWHAFRRLRAYHARPRSLDECVTWGQNFGSGGHFAVKTLQVPGEILALARKVEALKPKVTLEIGTARGGTLFIWSQLASELAISCDIEDKSVVAPLFKSFPPPDSNCRVELLAGDSHDRAFCEQVGRMLGGRKADFLFIDGDHSTVGARKDYEMYKGFVRPGGLIAFHDIVENQPLPGNQVYPLWKELRALPGAEEIIHDPKQCGFGIGVIRV